MEQFETIDNIREIGKDIAGMERMLKADELSKNKKIQDPAKLKEEIKTKSTFLNKVTPKKLKGVKANKAFQRLEQLKEIIGKDMVSENDYYRPEPKGSDSHIKKMDFEKVVERQVKFQTDPQIKKAVNEYKALARQLDPDDRHISNIESIRSSKNSKTFSLSLKGKDNFDKISWCSDLKPA